MPRLGLAAVVVALALSTAGCVALGLATAAPALLGGSVATGAMAQEKSQDRGAGGSPEEQDAKCEALMQAPPGVEEVRREKDGSIMSREWHIEQFAKAARWTLKPVSGAPPDGWMPKPGIDHLNFTPPLEPLLEVGKPVYLVYAPEAPMSIPENNEEANLSGDFDSTVGHGTFEWHGRSYVFELADKLPCFATPKKP